jgi:hypothetical protein
MKHMIALLFVFLSSSAMPAYAGDIGGGIGLGYPGSGLSFYADLSDDHFTQGLLGYGQGEMTLTGDFCFIYKDLARSIPTINPYYGIGASVVTTSGVGARIPVGVTFGFPEAPIQFALEVVPSLLLVPETRGALGFTAIVRYLFPI